MRWRRSTRPTPIFRAISVSWCPPATRGQEEPVFANIPIDTFALPMDADMRAGFSDLVKGRYVLIGGDIIDYDQFNTPLSRFVDPVTGRHETMIGLEVHAHMRSEELLVGKGCVSTCRSRWSQEH